MMDCRGCGACCYGAEGVDVVTPVLLSEARVLVGLTVYRQDLNMLVLKQVPSGNGIKCKSLVGTPGLRVTCNVYKDRPSFCKEMTPGDDACLAARKRMGL